MTYESQLVAKQHMIVDALQRIGKRRVETVPHRSKCRPSQRSVALPDHIDDCTSVAEAVAQQWIAGLHTYDDPANVFALQ